MSQHHFQVCHDDKLGYLDYDEKRFEQIFGIQYIKKLEFADFEVEQLVKNQCQKVMKKNRIGQNAKWLGSLYASKIESEYAPKVAIKWIHESIGYGVYALEDISAWQFIGEYAGVLRRRKILIPDLNDYCFMYPEIGLRLKNVTIDSKEKGNFTRYINHSDHPNIESIAVFTEGYYRIIFRSIKAIKAGTELSYDYGDIYWTRRTNKLKENAEGFILPNQR